MSSGIPCVMLAAGASERMGQWKMSMRWNARTIIEETAARALEVCSCVVLVSGHRAEELETIFSSAGWKAYGSRLRIVNSENWSEGMFASARTGFAETTGGWCFLALGDMPLVGPEIYSALAGYAGADAAWHSVIPQFRGKKGHPVLLSPEAVDYALGLSNSDSMRDVISAFPSLIIPLGSRGILDDIDTPEDYRINKS